MALTAKELIEIERPLAADGADMGPFVRLRRRLPQLSWDRCHASELSDQPFRVDLHMLDRSDRCVQITPDPTRPTSVLLAKRNGVRALK